MQSSISGSVPALILGVLLSFSASAKEPPKGLRVACHDKPFANLPGDNSLIVSAAGAEFTAELSSYDKPLHYPKLQCRFHKTDGGVFSCAQGDALAILGERRHEIGIDGEGRERIFDGYQVEVVKNPLGAAKSVMILRFPAASCSFTPSR